MPRQNNSQRIHDWAVNGEAQADKRSTLIGTCFQGASVHRVVRPCRGNAPQALPRELRRAQI